MRPMKDRNIFHIPQLIQEFRAKKIVPGDVVSVYGCLCDNGLRRNNPPYYVCEEENFSYRTYHPYGTIWPENSENLKYCDDSLAYYLKDDKGYYLNDIYILFPRGRINESKIEKKNSCVIHLIPFGIKYAGIEPLFTGESQKEDIEPYEMLRITGELMTPKNTDECGIEIGIGNFRELSVVDIDHPENTIRSLVMEKYDPRPHIDFSWCPPEEQNQKIHDLLRITGCKYENFNFFLDEDADIPEQCNGGMSYNSLNFWTQ